jgi:hypothetical protein
MSSGLEVLRASNQIIFESSAAVVVGPADKNALQKMIPRMLRKFDDRSVLSYGEVKRYIAVTSDGTIHVYAEATDPTVLYVIPLVGLVPRKEDPLNPYYYSHTISPEPEAFANSKSKRSIHTVLLVKGGNIKFQFSFDTEIVGNDACERFVAACFHPYEVSGAGGKERRC